MFDLHLGVGTVARLLGDKAKRSPSVGSIRSILLRFCRADA